MFVMSVCNLSFLLIRKSEDSVHITTKKDGEQLLLVTILCRCSFLSFFAVKQHWCYLV